MQPCARPTDLFVVSCPDPILASVTLSSHMTNGILLTRHNQEIAQWSPDPFPRERVGSGHETRGPTAHSSENRYEWVLIHETWPVQKVQSKNAISSSDCTTALYSSSHECVHGRYTGSSREPYVIVVSTISST